MTPFDLFEAMGDIPEEMLEEALDVRRGRRGRIGRILPAAAACILVSAVSLAVYHFGDGREITQNETAEATAPAVYINITGQISGERNADDVYSACGVVPETETESALTGNAQTGGEIYGYPYDPNEQYPVYTTIYDPAVTVAPAYEPGDPGLTATETVKSGYDITGTVYDITETVEVFTSVYPGTTMNLITSEPYPVPELPEYTADTEVTRIPEVAVIPHWEDMDDMERYSGLEFSGSSYVITDNKFDLSELTYIGGGELCGYDVYSEKVYSKGIGVYSIDGVNSRYMAAVLTADGKYTGFEDVLYKPDTLGDYLTDTDFERRHFPARLYSGDTVSAWEHMEYDFPGLEEQVKLLLEAGSDGKQVSVPPPDFGVSILSLTDSSGEYVMTIYGGGCIVVLGKIFDVGEENTEYFINMAERSSVKSELVPYGESAGGHGDIVPE